VLTDFLERKVVRVPLGIQVIQVIQESPLQGLEEYVVFEVQME
jgi:hypothetical protein